MIATLKEADKVGKRKQSQSSGRPSKKPRISHFVSLPSEAESYAILENLMQALAATGKHQTKELEWNTSTGWFLPTSEAVMPCKHSAEGFCAVLASVGTYYHPGLQLVVDPLVKSVLLSSDIGARLAQSGAPHSQDALKHTKESFAIEEDLEAMYRRVSGLHLSTAIPGLPMPAAEYSQCKLCSKWTKDAAEHAGAHSNLEAQISLEVADRPQHSIPLIPAQPAMRLSVGPAPGDSAQANTIQSPVSSCDNDLVYQWMDPSFKNQTGPKAPRLTATSDGSGFTFQARGRIYACLHPNLKAGDQLLVNRDIYTGCAVLNFYQLYYAPKLRAVVSPKKQTLVERKRLLRIINQRNPMALIYPSNALVDHVFKSFGLTDIETPEAMWDAVLKSIRIGQYVVGLPKPMEYWRCSHCGLFCSNNKHCEEGDKGSRSQKITAIAAWKDNNYAGFKLQLANSLQASSQRKPSAPMLTFPQPLYLDQEHIKEIHSLNGSLLLSLVELPSVSHLKTYCNDLQYPADTEKLVPLLGKVEQFLSSLHATFKQYLEQAEEHLQHSHISVRRVVAEANSTGSAELRIATPELIQATGGTGIRAIAIMLRQMVLQLYAKPLYDRLDGFSPRPTEAELALVVGTLRRIANSADGQLGNSERLTFVHKFLILLFTEPRAEAEKIASVAEQVLILRSALLIGETVVWKSGRGLEVLAGHFIRLLRAMMTHAGVSGGFKCSLLTKTRDSAMDGSFPPHSSSAASGDDNGENQRGVDVLEDLLAGKALRIGDKIYCFAIDNKKFIDPEMSLYAYSRIKKLCRKVHAVKHQEGKSEHTYWTQDGNSDILHLSWRSSINKLVDIQQLRVLVFRAVEEHLQFFHALFPPAFPMADLQAAQIALFQDNEDSRSLFDLPCNKAILNPIRHKLRTQITTWIKSKQISIANIHQRSQDYLMSLAVCLYLTGAIPPRSAQTVKFTYNSATRSFRLLAEKQAAFVYPKISRHGILGDSNLCLLPPQVAHTLFIYLGCFRPVEIGILKETAAPKVIEQMESHIFVHPLRRSPEKVWTADDLDACLKSRSPLQIEGYGHALIQKAIINKFLCELVGHMDEVKVLNKQSQHAMKTSNRHYAVEKLQGASGLVYTIREKLMVVGQQMQVFGYLGKPIHGVADPWKTIADVTSALARSQVHAFNVARDLVVRQFNLRTLSEEAVSIQTRCLIRNAPYLYDSDAPDGSKLGSKSTTEIMLLFIRQYRPVHETKDSDLAKLLAASILLVETALREWCSGKWTSVVGEFSLLQSGYAKELDELSASILGDTPAAEWSGLKRRVGFA